MRRTDEQIEQDELSASFALLRRELAETLLGMLEKELELGERSPQTAKRAGREDG